MVLRWGRGWGTCLPPDSLVAPPDSKASWPFWRDFWGPKMLQNPNSVSENGENGLDSVMKGLMGAMPSRIFELEPPVLLLSSPRRSVQNYSGSVYPSDQQLWCYLPEDGDVSWSLDLEVFFPSELTLMCAAFDRVIGEKLAFWSIDWSVDWLLSLMTVDW